MSEHDKIPEDRRDVPGGGFDPGHTPQEVVARTGDQHEHTDARSRPLIVFMIGVLIALGVVNIAIGGFGWLLVQRHRATARPRSELTTRPQAFPEPRLQSSPKADMELMLAEENELQHGYGWVDRKAGLVRIPIARAIELVGQRGLPPKRTDIPTTAGAEAAARAAASLTTATAANIRAAGGIPPTPSPAPSQSQSELKSPSPSQSPSQSMPSTRSTSPTPPAHNTLTLTTTTTTRKAGP